MMTDKQRKSIAARIAIVVILLVLPVLYVGGYFAMLRPASGWENNQGLRFGPPGYRFGGKVSEWFFRPMYNIDRDYLRRGQWFDVVEGE